MDSISSSCLPPVTNQWLKWYHDKCNLPFVYITNDGFNIYVFYPRYDILLRANKPRIDIFKNIIMSELLNVYAISVQGYWLIVLFALRWECPHKPLSKNQSIVIYALNHSDSLCVTAYEMYAKT